MSLSKEKATTCSDFLQECNDNFLLKQFVSYQCNGSFCCFFSIIKSMFEKPFGNCFCNIFLSFSRNRLAQLLKQCHAIQLFRHTGIPGFRTQELKAGLWTLDSRLWTLNSGLWTLDIGCWALDAGLWTLDAGLWMLDVGRSILDAGRWVLGTGHYYWRF